MDQRASASLLVLEDSPDLRARLVDWAANLGYQVAAAETGMAGLRLCRTQTFQVGLFNLRLPESSGRDIPRQRQLDGKEMKVIHLATNGTIETVVEAMKLGAGDFLTRRCCLPELEERCRMAIESGHLKREKRQQGQLKKQGDVGTEMVGRSPVVQARLLRVLEDGSFRRVGSLQESRVDVRLHDLPPEVVRNTANGGSVPPVPNLLRRCGPLRSPFSIANGETSLAEPGRSVSTVAVCTDCANGSNLTKPDRQDKVSFTLPMSPIPRASD